MSVRVCVCGARAGTERFRPRREQPGSNGARGSVLRAVAAHRRGMLRPRARAEAARGNIHLPCLASNFPATVRRQPRCNEQLPGESYKVLLTLNGAFKL